MRKGKADRGHAKQLKVEPTPIFPEVKRVKTFGILATLLSLSTALLAAEPSAQPKKTPHAKIIVRPGPPVKPTGPAKPVGNVKSDWTGKEKR